MTIADIFNPILRKYGWQLVVYNDPAKAEPVISSTRQSYPVVSAQPIAVPIDVPTHVIEGSLPRGIRNNNPGNIDLPAVWQGSIKGSDPRFCQFKNMAYGIRALAMLLLHYQTAYKLMSIRQMIYRWAPPIENNTSAYVTAVATACGVSPDAAYSLTFNNLKFMVMAIIMHENGAATANLVQPKAIVLGVSNALGTVPIADVEGYHDGA